MKNGKSQEVKVRGETLHWAAEMARVGERAVRKAQEENRRLGIPNVYSIDGRIVYEAPDGRLVEEDTYEQWQREIARQSSDAGSARG